MKQSFRRTASQETPRIHTSPPLDPNLNQMNSIHIEIHYFFKIH